MKATGIVRNLDNLGRVVIPKELRNTFGLNDGDPMEVFVNGETIVLKKYSPGCVLCGSVDQKIVVHKGRQVCHGCIDDLTSKLPFGDS